MVERSEPDDYEISCRQFTGLSTLSSEDGCYDKAMLGIIRKKSNTPTDTRWSFFDKCFKAKNGKIVLFQRPNLSITVWLIARILILPLHGTPQKTAQAVAFGALFTWAWLELFSGVNYFRRTLGFVVLISVDMAVIMHGLF